MNWQLTFLCCRNQASLYLTIPPEEDVPSQKHFCLNCPNQSSFSTFNAKDDSDTTYTNLLIFDHIQTRSMCLASWNLLDLLQNPEVRITTSQWHWPMKVWTTCNVIFLTARRTNCHKYNLLVIYISQKYVCHSIQGCSTTFKQKV